MYEVTIHPSSKPFVLKVPTRKDDCLGRREEMEGVEFLTKSQRSLPGRKEGGERGHTTTDRWHFISSRVSLESSEEKYFLSICQLSLISFFIKITLELVRWVDW